MTCVNWIPEIWYTDETKTKTGGVMCKQRDKLFCYICRKKQSGSLLQCDYKSCQFSFHVRCAMGKGLIKDWESMDEQRENEEDTNCYVFCDKHLE